MKLLQNRSPEAAAHFLREATITSRLQHPSIRRVHDVVRRVDDTPCCFMLLYLVDPADAAAGAPPELVAIVRKAMAR